MTRYIAFLWNEALAVMSLTGVFLLIYSYELYLDFSNGNGRHSVDFSYGFLGGLLIGSCIALNAILNQRTIILMPIALKVKFTYLQVRSLCPFLLFLLLSVVPELLMRNCIGGGLIGVFLNTPKYCIAGIFIVALSFTFSLLFRQQIIKIISLILLLFCWFILMQAEVHYNGSAILQAVILLLSVAITAFNYQIFKRWQPANNGFLMI
ncbi:MAG: hypothetical protein E7070_01970 [Bacteroidales bacterium]|nr:hypothetical protein [Bacteroidales bacterium]